MTSCDCQKVNPHSELEQKKANLSETDKKNGVNQKTFIPSKKKNWESWDKYEERKTKEIEQQKVEASQRHLDEYIGKTESPE